MPHCVQRAALHTLHDINTRSLVRPAGALHRPALRPEIARDSARIPRCGSQSPRDSVAPTMDSREMETLVQRLVQNPHDQDAIRQAHASGQRDPKSYAMLLEKVGTATA